MDLFSAEKTVLKLPDAELTYIPEFLDNNEAENLFQYLKQHTNWQHDNITVFGKTYKQPRLTAFYNESDKPYTYSNITMLPRPFPLKIAEIKKKIETITKSKFNSVLLNLYRDGNDSNGWHADDEKSLGINPVIASLSLGTERVFHFKHRHIKPEKYKIKLQSGSLLVMSGSMQHHWLHQIPKTKKKIGERINLTFRKIH